MHVKGWSVEKRILLHLAQYVQRPDQWDAPVAVGQEGIAASLHLLPNNVSRALTRLAAEGFIESRLAHVQGTNRRRKAYALTGTGTDAAATLRERARHDEYAFRMTGGKREVLTGAAILERLVINGGIALSESQLVESARLADPLTPEVCTRLLTELANEGHPIRLPPTAPRSITNPAGGALVHSHDQIPMSTRFVGRGTLIDEMSAHLLPDGGTVAIIGIAGIGKSALCAKVVERLAGDFHTCWIRAYDWDTPTSVMRQVALFLKRAGRTALHRAVIDSHHPVEMGVAAAALTADLEGLAVLLVIDDVHKAADQLEGLLTFLKDLACSRKGFALVVISRRDLPFFDERDIHSSQTLLHRRLGGLDRAESRTLLERLPPTVADRWFALTKGVPLFLELIGELQTPEPVRSIEAFIEQEVLGRLSPSARAALESIAVFRGPIDGTWARTQLGVVPLEELRRASMLLDLPGERIECHDLVREHVATRITTLRRIELHHQAAICFDSRGALEDHLEAIHHLQQAQEWRQAATRIMTIGPEAIEAGHLKVGEVLDAFPPDVDLLGTETLARLQLLRGDVSAAREQWDEAIAAYEHARVLMQEIGVVGEPLGQVHGRIGWVHLQTAQTSAALENHTAALAIFRRRGDTRGIAKELLDLGVVYRHRGAYDQAITHYLEARDLLGGLQDSGGLAAVENNLGQTYQRLGRRSDAEAAYRAALAPFEEESGGWSVLSQGMFGGILTNLALFLAEAGRWDEATLRLEQAQEAYASTDQPGPSVATTLRYAKMLRNAGKPAEALRQLERAMVLFRSALVAEVPIDHQGRPTEPLTLLRRGLNLADGAALCREAAQCAADLSDHPAQQAHLTQAIAWTAEPAAEARRRLELAWVLEQADQEAAAIGQLQQALTRVREVDDHEGEVAILLNLGRVLRGSDPKESKNVLRRALRIAKDQGDRRGAARAEDILNQLR